MTEACLLNTRAIAQQQETYDVFTSAGFQVINFPCLAIHVTDNPEQALQYIEAIQAKDTLIFTSQQAVYFAFQIMPQWSLLDKTIIAVGTKTAHLLEQHTPEHIFTPDKHNSEGVIELLKGLKEIKTIQLITAPNGRNQIQNFAFNNHITLQQINVYQRTIPEVSQQALKAIEECHLLHILATSTTTLKHLKLLIPKALWPKIIHATLICASIRIEKYAQQLGFKKCYNANTANPEVIAEQLKTRIMQ